MEVTPDPDILEKLFRHKVLRLLLDEGAIDEQVVANLLAWPHTGFGAHLSREIPTDPVSRENVARYLAHPPIVLDRIVGDPSAGKILYTGERVIAVIDQEGVIYRILSHLNLLSPGDGPRAPPKSVISASPASAGLRELSYEPVFDDLPWAQSA